MTGLVARFDLCQVDQQFLGPIDRVFAAGFAL